MNPTELSQPSRPSGFSATLNELHATAMKALLLIVGVSAFVVAVAIYLREGWSSLTGMALFTGTAMAGMWFLLKLGKTELVTRGLVLVFLLVSTLGILHNGSVRSAASYVLLASMVVAGSYLSKAEALAAGAYIVGMLGVTNWLEQQGQLSGVLPSVGWTVWVLQSVVMAAILITALYGRYRLIQVVKEQEAALEAAHEAQVFLRASQSRFQALFDNNPAACLVQSFRTMQVLDANETFCAMFGYSRETLRSEALPAIWVDTDAEMAFRQALREQGHVRGLCAQGLRQDGATIDCVVYGEVIRQAEEPIVLIMVLDTSKETASRKEMEKAQERFQKAFEFSPLGMTITRLTDGQIMAANPANKDVLGWTAEDFAGKTMLEVGVWASSEERQRFVEGLRTHGRLRAHETIMRSKQGSLANVKVWAERIELAGEDCALAFTLNVNEEKQREAMLINIAKGVSSHTGEAFFPSWAEHLAQAVGASHVMVAETAEEARINTLALHVDGTVQVPEVVDIPNKLLARLLFQEGILFIENPSSQDLDLCPDIGNGPSQPTQALAGIVLKDADGSAIGIIYMAWTAPPLLQSPQMQALISIFSSRCNAELVRLRRDREISRLYDTLEQRVQARTAQLQYLNRELDSFAYSVSHDLKSPLRAIDGFLHMLHHQMAERMMPDDQDLFDKVASAASRMGSLIADMLSLARASQGQLQRMNVNLNDLIDSVIRRERERDPTHEVDIVIAPDMQADCDPRMAQIVFENLIGNAWKYSHKVARPCIELGQRPTQPGEPAVFYVKDNGAGFDMEQANRLFRPFTRLHSAREFEGSGIGLATVRRILERHGGFVRAEGEVGKGATFEFGFGLQTLD
jgi:PAS domain S-box-containing protein